MSKTLYQFYLLQSCGHCKLTKMICHKYCLFICLCSNTRLWHMDENYTREIFYQKLGNKVRIPIFVIVC